ncbi:LamG-like jellyroll fold domain-containing protein [Streptomyces sp. NPDC055099]
MIRHAFVHSAVAVALASSAVVATPWAAAAAENRPPDQPVLSRFANDTEEPAKPSVSSPEYPDDTESWHDGVGAYGTFTVDSSSDDTVSYVYNFTGEKRRTAEPKEPGGPVELRWMPKSSGVHQLSVQAIDRAGNASGPVNYVFRVASGRTPVAGWKLADPSGSDRADATAGGGPAEAVGSVTFGAEGPSRTDVKSAVELDGSDGGHLTSGAPAVDAKKAFAVSAWVRPGEAGRDMTAVSQSGDGAPAFALGADAEGNWSFSLGGGTPVRAKGGLPESGEWAHLTGVYDPVERTARLYVNGRLVDTAEDASSPGGTGVLQIGRGLGADGQGGAWDGRIAAVQVWDRVVVPAEAAALGKRATAREGHWQFDESAGGASPERDGRQPMKLGGDARIHRDDSDCGLDPECVPGEIPMVGEGQLKLDGEGDYAATAGPVVDTGDSFSLAAHVQLDPAAEGRTMTVLSLPGEQTDLAALRYTPEQQSWELTLAHEDRAGAETTKLTADNDWASSGEPHHLAVVYDDGADEILLYVDGHLSAKAPFHRGLRATGGLQVGRAGQAEGGSEYLHGAVDDVQAYAGALSEQQVAVLRAGGTAA